MGGYPTHSARFYSWPHPLSWHYSPSLSIVDEFNWMKIHGERQWHSVESAHPPLLGLIPPGALSGLSLLLVLVLALKAMSPIFNLNGIEGLHLNQLRVDLASSRLLKHCNLCHPSDKFTIIPIYPVEDAKQINLSLCFKSYM